MLNEDGNIRMPRDNEPKPASLIEMAEHPPGFEVPEVSLLFDQDKNKAVNPRANSSNHYNERNTENHLQLLGQNDLIQANQFETYNTWKAKNVQALQNITGGLPRTEIISNHVPSTRKIISSKRRQSSNTEMYRTSEVEFSELPASSGNRIMNRINPTNKPTFCSFPSENGNITKNLVQSSDIQHDSCSTNSHLPDNCMQQNTFNQIHPQMRETHQHTLQSCPQKHQFHVSNHIPENSNCQNVHHRNTYETRRLIGEVPNKLAPNVHSNTTNTEHCQCTQGLSIGNNPSPTKMQFINRHLAEMNLTDSNTLSKFDLNQINNQLGNLYHIINLQNEQILMLLQEVKQIHQVVLQIPTESICSPSKQTNKCHSCSCGNQKDNVLRHITCLSPNTGNDLVKNINPSEVKTSLEKSKRSIGIMTSIPEQVENKSRDAINDQVDNQGSLKIIKQHHQKKQACNVPTKQPKRLNPKGSAQQEEKREPQFSTKQIEKKSNKGVKHTNTANESFSLNEAEIIIRTEAEQDVSPNISLHVDMPDYSNSSCASNESDSSESSSDEDDEEESSVSEGESSEPQIGWTFYDRVVGQVNNILKKPSQNQQEQFKGHRRLPPNQPNMGNGEYETENNWSKRVTFDGPPLEDSDNMLRFGQPKPGQDYRSNGCPERFHDMMMYNAVNGGTNLSFANGSANVSFATLRYLERYQLLPSYPGIKMPEQMFQETQKSTKPVKKKKKSKSKAAEKISQESHKSYKRKVNDPPSKLLDITALKRQPKLF